MSLDVIFYGTRGSISATSEDTLKYGSHTTCVVVNSGEKSIILDAGFGIGFYSDHLVNKMGEFHLLISHFHWDHIQGLNYFGPIHHPKSTNHFYTPKPNERLKEVMDIYFDGSYGPFNGWKELNSKFVFHKLEGDLQINGFLVSYRPINHTDPCFAYKISDGEHTIVYATDHECVDNENNREFVKWAKGCDILVHDAMYTENEYKSRTGWGHSTFAMACRNAIEIGAKKVILTHHEPLRTDIEIDTIEAGLKKEFPSLNLAFAQQEVVYKP